ncbi:MAG: peptide chain release factor 2 [Leptonema sp. (in: bacteria)]
MQYYVYKSFKEVEKEYQKIKSDFEEIWKRNQMDSKIAELKDWEQTMQKSNFWEDIEKAKMISQKKAALEKNIKPWIEIQQMIQDFPLMVELLKEENTQQEALEKISKEIANIKETIEEIQISLALLGEDDNKNAIMTIVPGAGGTESQDWAEMLLRMYTRWFQKKGFEYEILDYQSGEEAGIKNVTLLVKGENAYGYLKCENGIHRLVRISPFDANKKRHTSFASVHVAPEIDESIDIQINEKDLRIDTFRSSGAGGQHVNKTDSAVRILHVPTGIMVQCQNERSQHQNRERALKILKTKLYELEKQKKEKEIELRSGEKKDVSWGNQIRSYVFHPYKMIKDLRTDYEISDVDRVMDGEIDEFIKAYLKDLASKKFKT